MSRATIDGQPHEMLTSVVCITGIIVAVIIISFLIFLLHKMNSIQMHLQNHKSNTIIDVEAQRMDLSTTKQLQQLQNDCKQPQTNAISSEMKVFSISENLKSNENCSIE